MTDLADHTPATSSTLDPCGGSSGAGHARPILATHPQVSNRYHFGMLLGVDDLDTDQAYHRGKHWLHQAWLHRDGVVWGYAVARHGERELRVGPGLALDCRGRELSLDQGMCIDLPEWFEAHRPEANLDHREGQPAFTAHVVARFRACLDRQVPALRDVCADPDEVTAYSRTVETVDLELVSGPPPEQRPSPYPRLRAVLGLGDPLQDWEPVGDPATDVPNALTADAVSIVDETQIVANERIVGERPVWPCPPDETDVILAKIEVALTHQAGRWDVASVTIDNSVRRVLLDTSTIQQLLLDAVAARTSPFGVHLPGPQLDPDSLTVENNELKVISTAALRSSTLTADALTVSGLGNAGWTELPLADGAVTFDEDDRQLTITVEANGTSLDEFEVVRLIARGTGPTPILDDQLNPLAGVTGQRHPPGTRGADAVLDHGSS